LLYGEPDGCKLPYVHVRYAAVPSPRAARL
jgi:hypothetical protein